MNDLSARRRRNRTEIFQIQSQTQVTDWTVGVSVPRTALEEPVKHALAVYAAAGGSLFFAALALAFFVGGHISGR